MAQLLKVPNGHLFVLDIRKPFLLLKVSNIRYTYLKTFILPGVAVFHPAEL